MKTAVLLLATLTLTVHVHAHAEEKCTKDKAKEAVLKICGSIEKDGDKALEEVKSYRFCGDNYVWVQDSDLKMVTHPIKPKLNGSSLAENKDDNGTKLFVEFDKKAKAEKDGGWVDYVWPKPNAEKATPKTSFVKMCGGAKKWIAGSGIWKD